MRRLLVFPADPLAAYVRKGEIKERYFNPGDLFGEVHIISADETPVDDAVLQTLGGRALVVHHALGQWRVLSRSRSPYAGPYRDAVVVLARKLRPSVVRAYTPLEVGWLARASAHASGVPYLVSLHGNYDLDIRTRLREQRLWRGYLYHSLTRPFVERPVLRDAAAVICAYEFAAVYARAMGRGDATVVYNRVYLRQFRPSPRPAEFTVLFVGRCDENKGQELILRAMPNVPGRLLLVGDGPTLPRLRLLAAQLGIGRRVEFIPSVPNAEMPDVYARASCFASAVVYGGLPIPHLEAMASGLPLVVATPTWEREPEQMGDVALVPARDPVAFAAALRRVSDEPQLADELAQRSLRRAAELSGDKMETREREIYERVIAG